MAKERRTGTLIYPSYDVRPEDFLHYSTVVYNFVETDEFRDDWQGLGLDVETDLLAIQAAIMVSPELYPIIKGTGGLRKARFAPEDSNCGKSGSIRVCYAYFKEHWTVLLVMAYGKQDKENISKRERDGIKRYLEVVKKYLDGSNY